MTTSSFQSLRGFRAQPTRGSALITALIFAIVLAITLTSYLKLSTNSLKLAHRTFFADSASNICETGLEEAVWSFNTMGNSADPTVVANAWSGWTLGGSVADVYMAAIGSGYTSAPTVTISGGGGSGATGVATITTIYPPSGSPTSITGVTSVTITNKGSGYTSLPTITLSGGGGTGAVAIARLAGTRTFTFNNLDQNASATVKVWVAGYDGMTNTPLIVAKSTITPFDGAPIVKYIKVIVSKHGALAKGVVAKYGITWNGHPFADSYKSSPTPGVPPFAAYSSGIAQSNTTVASLAGPTISLGQGTVDGNVMTGPGVTLTGGTVTGQKIGNFDTSFNYPTVPTASSVSASVDFAYGTSLPSSLPRAGDTPAADGNYYYFVHGATLEDMTISAPHNVVIVGDRNTSMASGFNVQSTSTTVGKATVYMDGTISLSGNDTVNNTSWAGALQIYTTTTQTISFSGNAQFYGCIFAPNAALVGNGGGNTQEDLCGSFVVNSVSSNGHMSFHYDEGLNNMTSGKPWSLALWKELQTASDRALYASQLTF